jgi:hypothetical protein
VIGVDETNFFANTNGKFVDVTKRFSEKATIMAGDYS